MFCVVYSISLERLKVYYLYFYLFKVESNVDLCF